MKKTDDKSKSTILRQKAEELLKKKSSKAVSGLSEQDTLKLIHELEVHQIQLEMMNEELALANENAILASEEKEIATQKYTDLYDSAPTGYFTLTRNGKIIGLNLSGCQMLGKERQHLRVPLKTMF